MKKKTIKSYFFKNYYNNHTTDSMFCFSKRSIKQKKIIKIGVNKELIKSHRLFNENTKNIRNYKFFVTQHVKYNQ